MSPGLPLTRISKLGLRARLLASFLAVVLLTGGISVIAGVKLIGEGIVREAQERVAHDLNSARHVYEGEIERVGALLRLTSQRFFLRDGMARGEIPPLRRELERIRKDAGLDILVLGDAKGRVLLSSRNPERRGDSLTDSELVRTALDRRKTAAGTEIIPRKELLKESQDLAARALIEVVPTPRAKPAASAESASGMGIFAAAPVGEEGGRLTGVIYGGVLLNRDYTIVDSIKDIVYHDMAYRGRDIGTTTIFQRDLRISTNVLDDSGERAIGTRVSAEVYEAVLEEGRQWIGRAFVVNAWYITAYEPIRTIGGETVGMLYVGLLERKFSDLRRKTVLAFLGIALVGMGLAAAIAILLAGGISGPVGRLAAAAKRMSGGELGQSVEIAPGDEIGDLGQAFNAMAASIKERDERLRESARRMVARSERMALVGRLAAGVAHEINNPLSGIMTYSHLLMESEELTDPARKNAGIIAAEAQRCRRIVKGLLDFARESKPEKRPVDVEGLLSATLSLVAGNPEFRDVEVLRETSGEAPLISVDASQIQQVFLNIIMNAAQAMEGKGELKIGTGRSADGRFLEVWFADTGPGVRPGDIERLFEPFFTTREAGKGTGLGLAISQGIIEGHGGRIDVRSEPEKGATFTVSLPV